LEFRDWQPYAELLNSYSAIDIALDPFPFAGGATTCEALWMGVPVVTWPGETFSSRHSCSYLRTIGLEELIAANAGDYVKIAVQLAEDLPRLQALRESLRPKIQSSPFCDSQRCANDLATILRKMWSGDVG
jgi:predicted O-linked N-acetylglucosamine transferase (SPINDLY family)